jgi:hypothetical protein
MALIWVIFLVFQVSPPQPLGLATLAAFGLIQFHAIGINRRLNALLNLFEEDRQRVDSKTKDNGKIKV